MELTIYAIYGVAILDSWQSPQAERVQYLIAAGKGGDVDDMTVADDTITLNKLKVSKVSKKKCPF